LPSNYFEFLLHCLSQRWAQTISDLDHLMCFIRFFISCFYWKFLLKNIKIINIYKRLLSSYYQHNLKDIFKVSKEIFFSLGRRQKV
jgi:hypothetical protein